MSKENKNYKLKSSTRPSKPGALLTTVQVIEAGKRGYCYITFSDKLVEAVGKKLPRGIYSSDPAYLTVEYHDFMWAVYASYVSGGIPQLMWRQATKPLWLSFHEPRKVKDGNTTTAEDKPRSQDTHEGDTDPNAGGSG